MKIEESKKICDEILDSISEIFVGKKEELNKVLCASLANGHVLFEDYPGLGKTLLTKLFSKAIGCEWKRIQFTPDLMPADILGTRVWQPEKATFHLEKGPIFSNVILADEVNRASPKTQSALLEAMEERQVTIEGNSHILENPFFVIATQNPLELEGTYPLPEAQLDRFILKLSLGYVDSLENEIEILRRRIDWETNDPSENFDNVTSQETFRSLQMEAENSIFVHESILEYIMKIVRNTRKHPKVEVGASPRGGLSLLRLSKAKAVTEGRDFVIPDDIKDFATGALSHRVIVSSEHMLEGIDANSIIEEVVGEVETPRKYKPGTEIA